MGSRTAVPVNTMDTHHRSLHSRVVSLADDACDGAPPTRDHLVSTRGSMRCEGFPRALYYVTGQQYGAAVTGTTHEQAIGRWIAHWPPLRHFAIVHR